MKIRLLFATTTIVWLTGCATTAPAPTPVAVNYEVHFNATAYNSKDVDNQPMILNHVFPIYPLAFNRAGIAGNALLEFILEENGRVSEVQTRSASDIAFAEAAKAAVSNWVFTPAKKNGQVVKCRMQIPFKFDISQ